jgi:asparagine synthase (glutamine-hydrolysing)
MALNNNIDINLDLINKMIQAIKHRGPDDSGYHLDNGIALGHTRLSIIDIESGHQPIYNEDKTKCIIFNGEIYNYLDLRKDLIASEHIFSTKSDTEVILHLYEEKGYECVNHLRGMFAFAIWDKQNRTLFIARDRLGIKPVYYSVGTNWLCFSSEIKSLLVSGLVKRELNLPSIDQYLALNYTIGPQTILQSIKKLMPGHYMVYHQGQIETTRYWDFHDIRETSDPFDLCMEKMEALIEESVRIRLMSEVPLGAFLSGGVDSSVTVGVMTRLTNRPVKTFTVGYENAGEESELDYARQVAKHFNSEHHEFILNPKKFMDIVSKVVWHLDEPVAEFATIPLLLLSELAKKHVTVMLSGEGADEIFAGYPIYRLMNYIEHYRKLPAPLRRHICDPIAAAFLGNKREGKYMDWLSAPLEKRYLGNGSYFTESMRKKLYTREFEGKLDTREVQRTVASYYRRVGDRDAIRKMLYLDTKTWLPEDLLIKADKMTMAAALELRVPFLDHHLLEFATSLPSKMKATVGQSKYIFKKYAEKILPKEIVYRKKKGFPVPVRQWLREDLYDVARDILLDQKTKDRGIFNSSYVGMLFEQHACGAEDFSKNIWNLLILEMWMRIFIDGEYNWSQN